MPEEDGWVGLKGGIRKGPGGQEVVDESRGRDWWARTGQGRSKRTATEMTSETKLSSPSLFFSHQTLVCAKGWQRAHLWLT